MSHETLFLLISLISSAATAYGGLRARLSAVEKKLDLLTEELRARK